MAGHEISEGQRGGRKEQLVPVRLLGVQRCPGRPFWGLMGIWAVFCGALASGHWRLDGEGLLTVAIALLLVELAWSSLWDLGSGTDWFRPLASGWPPARPAVLRAPPFTRPDSPGGRLLRGLNRLVGWWKESFWPEEGATVVGLLAAALLAIVLSMLLPSRLRPLNAALIALVGLALAQRRRRASVLGAEALVLVGLSWLAGHLIFAEMSLHSLVLALAFSVAVWGSMRVARQLPGGLWLQNGGQVVSAALLLAAKQPLAAGLVGMLLLGQVAAQLLLGFGADPSRVSRRTWPWLMATMLTAAWAIP